MSRNTRKNELRRQRQAKRSHEISENFMKENPDAAILFVKFGTNKNPDGSARGRIYGPAHAVDEVAKVTDGLSVREKRSRQRDALQRIERQKRVDRAAEEKKLRERAMEEKAKGRQVDQRGASRQMTRKGIT